MTDYHYWPILIQLCGDRVVYIKPHWSFSSEWFKVIYYLVFVKFEFHFSVLNPGEKCQLWTETLDDTWKRFGANSGHIYGTCSGHWVFRLIVWLTGTNCTGRSAVWTCWFTGTFYPVFHNGSGPISVGEQNNGFCLFWSSSRVNIALAYDQKTDFVK